VLQELVQNADDAGARTVKFLWDETEYPAVNIYRREHTSQFQVGGTNILIRMLNVNVTNLVECTTTRRSSLHQSLLSIPHPQYSYLTLHRQVLPNRWCHNQDGAI
jgi:hypothetical protein